VYSTIGIISIQLEIIYFYSCNIFLTAVITSLLLILLPLVSMSDNHILGVSCIDVDELEIYIFFNQRHR
jgi:hypothetical protein